MSEHERTISVQAPAREVFQYLSSVSNLPDFVPHLSGIREEENGHVFGLADLGEGCRREVSGFFRPDGANLYIGWESDGTPGYRGWLQVAPEGDDRSRVTVHISMLRAAEETPPREPGLASERIERTFDAVMRAIQDALGRRDTLAERGVTADSLPSGDEVAVLVHLVQKRSDNNSIRRVTMIDRLALQHFGLDLGGGNEFTERESARISACGRWRSGSHLGPWATIPAS